MKTEKKKIKPLKLDSKEYAAIKLEDNKKLISDAIAWAKTEKEFEDIPIKDLTEKYVKSVNTRNPVFKILFR